MININKPIDYESLRSPLIDRLMADCTEEERREATRHWFSFLHTMMKIVDELEADGFFKDPVPEGEPVSDKPTMPVTPPAQEADQR